MEVSLFVIALLTTFSRFIPVVKARYDYGCAIFILTYGLVLVSGYRVEKLMDVAMQRLFTIMIGTCLCIIISILVRPIWAGMKLHLLIACNMDKLANSLESCVAEYFSDGDEESKKKLQDYQFVLSSKASEESMAEFARWEPAHGQFGFKHPWKNYIKIGSSSRSCAYCIETLVSCLDSKHQVEGPKSPEEMLTILQRVLEESGPVLVTARLDAEERINNMRLREEQDAAYQAALEADQARERQRKEEEERLEREAAEAERKQKEEEEARERAAHEAAEREAALTKLREEKSLSLGPEPEKGPDVTQVLVRLPNGERKGRRFHSTSTIQSLYDFVDSSGCLEMESYTLVTNFPRVLYGQDKLSLTLKEVGLHPQASLFVEMKS